MTLLLDRPQPTRTSARTTSRRDIQGLRAVAVTAVIASHLLGIPAGGFVGVDIFFVVSGFLITGLLVREHARTGRVSLPDFYRRRVRRILPVSVAVLAVTTAAANVLYLGARAQSVTHDAVWSLLFSANWRFAVTGTDYFNAENAPSPLQHYWSLAVEEQFYLVWPLLVLGALAAGSARGTGRYRLTLLGVLVVGTSFATAMWQSADEPTVAYFSTFTRAWELGVGALLALAAPHLSRLGRTARAGLVLAGLAGIGAALVLVTGTTPFPGPGAALPVLATAAVIAAGTGSREPLVSEIVLGNRVARYVGDLSYSLYLWHWPVIIMLGAVMAPTAAYYLTALGVTGLLSVFSYHIVEEPVRHSQWLEPAHRRRGYRDHRADQLVRRAKGMSLALLLTLAGVLLAAAVGRAGPVPPAAAASAATTAREADEKELTADQQAARDVVDALRLTTFDGIEPSLDELADAGAPEWMVDHCLDVTKANLADCSYGAPDAPRTAVVLGDSVAVSWMPALRQVLPGDTWRIQLLTRALCPGADVDVDGDDAAECAAHRDWALSTTADLTPDLVVVGDAVTTFQRSAGAGSPDAWSAGVQRTLRAVGGPRTPAVVLTSPPGTGNLQDCATALATPAECVRSASEAWQELRTANAAAAEAGGATHVDPFPWFCYQHRCPAVVAGTPVYVDGVHLTAAYAEHLVPALTERLAAAEIGL